MTPTLSVEAVQASVTLVVVNAVVCNPVGTVGAVVSGQALVEALKGADGPIVAASDYMKVVVDQLAPWLPGRLETLGTDGFGRSENREYLRKHFEVSAESIAAAALSRLARDGKFDAKKARAAFVDLGIDTERGDPARA